MEAKHLSWFKVENFKRFDSLEVKDIGQFNLIVGDNNVGKTSLLEALLFDEENYDQFLINLEFALENRELYVHNDKFNYINLYSAGNKLLKYLFQFQGGEKRDLTITKKSRKQLTAEEVEHFIVQLKLNDSPHIIRIDQGNVYYLKVVSLLDENKNIYYHFPFLGSKIFYDEETFDFITKISASNKKLEIFKNELKYFLPNLTSIEVSKSIMSDDDTIIIRETGSDSPLPLAAYGDGFIKLFRCLLKMELSSNTRLMIDEIDTGIHYSRMKEFLKKIMQSAKNKNVQIFATTHSKECIKYYTQALEELGLQDSGRIIRIADTKIGIRAYTMQFAEFESAMDAGSEIR